MDWQAIAVFLFIVLAGREAQHAFEAWAHRRHLQMLERLIASRSAADFAAAEKILARPPAPAPGAPPPSAFDDIYGVKPSKGG